MAKQDKDKKKKRKLEKKARDKKQQFENPFLGKPVQDDNLPDFEISGNFTSKGYTVKDVRFDLTEGIGDNVNIAYGRGSRRVNMTRSTLEKSRATLIGMAPQENKLGQIVQGFNYANPNYTNAVQNNKDLQRAKSYYGVGGVLTDKKTQFDNQQKKVQAILDARVAVASLPDSMRGGAVEEAIKNAPYEQTEQQKINQANTNARLKQASRNKVKNYKANIARDPTVGYANEIQAKLGRAPISVVVTRRRRGRWSTSLSQDPAKIIDDYNKKTAVINWAKEIDPDHAQIDPERKVTIVDTSTPRRVANVWCHNNRCRTTGYSTVYDKTYKDVLATTRPEGEKMDLLYGKIINKSQEKKKKYLSYGGDDTELYKPFVFVQKQQLEELEPKITEKEKEVQQLKRAEVSSRAWVNIKNPDDLDSTKEQKNLDELKRQKTQIENQIPFNYLSYYSITDEQFAEFDEHKKTSEANKARYETFYNTDPTVDKYTYYNITDEEFGQMDEYKTALVTNIRTTDDARDALQNKIIGSFTLDATTPLDDNAPKQKYLQYQKTGQDDFITPTVNKLQSQITIDSSVTEKENLQNAIAFVEGKTRRFEVDGVKVARRDNFGRIKILDGATYAKYIKNTPSEYLKQPDQLDTTVIPELEEENKETTEKYNEIEKEYYRKERAKAQFGTIKPKRRVTVSRGGRRRRR